ncbi:hypothetical protein SAMN05446037_1002243 [Anaerovirgula multivorans]|uniref:Uncharacterized protein n=1 Tax=Anaerovirgula multivorans TaxID=312168 RepID=A0A239ASK0_9FIRM|nr:hypothetical protein [Anaerovirgula multivorans]SNR98685.1 hypothetical protein SAMN05446037_1002243 [Anaerovirgula multivorans]
MGSTLYQFFNLILIVVLLAVPIVITVLLLRHFGKTKSSIEGEEFLIEKIRELERRIEVLESQE